MGWFWSSSKEENKKDAPIEQSKETPGKTDPKNTAVEGQIVP